MKNINDCLGRPFHIGDYITFPSRKGSSLWVNVSRIVGRSKDGYPVIRSAATSYNGTFAAKHNSTLFRPERATIVPISALTPRLREVLDAVPEVPVEPMVTGFFPSRDNYARTG